MRFKLDYDFKIETALFRFSFERGERAVATLRQTPGQATVLLPLDFSFAAPAAQEWANKVLVSVLREHARLLLPPRLRALSEKHGLPFNRVVIKDVHTRWGSCSSLRNINLSLWLLLAPEHLVDYVMLHELAHLKEMNHSPRFWRELDCLTDGRAKALAAEMKAFSKTLKPSFS